MTVNWVGKSGSWGDAGNWDTGIPTQNDAVSIAVGGITVSIGSGIAAACYTLNVQGAAINLDGGSLYTVDGALFNGTVFQSAGTYIAGGTGAVFDQALITSGGTLDLLSGAAQLSAGGTLASAFIGNGSLDVLGGSTYVEAGFSCSLNNIVVGGNGGKLGWNINKVTYSHNFTVLRDGVLDLFGNTLTLAGNTVLDGTIGFGTLIESSTGTMALGAPNITTVLDNGLILTVSGHTDLDGTVALGANDSGAKINVGKTGNFAIAGNWNITDPAHVGYVSNAGTFTKSFGGLLSQVDAAFNNTGTIDVQIGTLLLDGPVNNISGSVSGAGTFALAGGQSTFGPKLKLTVSTFDQQGGVVILNKALTYAGTWNQTGGDLNLNATAAVLTLSNQANFDGGTLTGYGGTVNFNGVAHLGNVTIGGPDIININGTLDQTNNINFGLSSNPTANIAKGATWSLKGDSSIFGAFGLINNAGLFIDPNGSGDAVVDPQFVSTGTVTVNNSTLTLAGNSVLAGTVNGSGLLDIQGTSILANGVAMTVASLAVDTNGLLELGGSLSYANIFSSTNNNATLDLFGYTLTLTGRVSLDAGVLGGGGLLTSSGPTVLGQYDIGAGTTLQVTGSGEQSSDVDLGGALTVAAGAAYALDDDVNIFQFQNSIGALNIAGTLTANGTGSSIIDATVGQTGKLIINDQLLTLQAGGILGGAISGPGTLALTGQGGAFAYGIGGSITSGGLLLEQNATASIVSNLTYAGFFQETAGGTLAVSGDTLTLSGTATLSNGFVQGAGTVLLSGSGTLAGISVLQGANLTISGATEQVTSIQVGDGGNGQTPPSTAQLTIATGATYTLDAGASISGNGTLAVSGTLTANGNGTSQIGDTIVDKGVIAANLGTLTVLGAVGGSGVFSIGTGGLLEFANTATFTATSTVSFTTGGGDLQLDAPAHFTDLLANFSNGDDIGLYGFNASTLNGTYANQQHTAITFADMSGASVTLTFATAQDLTKYTYGTGANGLATIFHH